MYSVTACSAQFIGKLLTNFSKDNILHVHWFHIQGVKMGIVQQQAARTLKYLWDKLRPGKTPVGHIQSVRI